MSDYIKATNFTSKDTLPTGNAGKIVKGTEIDTEFTAIASAIASKADLYSPILTGVPVAPTATAGSSTTQIANTLYTDTAVTNERTSTVTLTNKTLTSPTINTPTISGGTITGITDLTVADGGTGSSTLAANSVLLGNGTSALQTVAPGSLGNSLVSNGTTWVSAQGYIGAKGQLFTTSGTFTVPAGITTLKITLSGGGGGGQVMGGGGNNYVSGGGGTSTFSTISATGGSGSSSGSHSNGSGSGGSINTSIPMVFGYAGYSGAPPAGYGWGGWGQTAADGYIAQYAGGNAGGSIGWLTVTPGGTVSVTVGAAGSAGSGEGMSGYAGVAGAVLVEW